MHYIKKIFFFLLIVSPQLMFGQQIISFLHDTVRIESYDTVFCKSGNEFTSEIEYGSNGYRTIVRVDSGFIVKDMSYYPGGSPMREYNYSSGELNGVYKSWNRMGKFEQTGYYKNGHMDSTWTYYYSNGMKETVGSFLADTASFIKDFTWAMTVNDSLGNITGTKFCRGRTSPPHGIWKFYDLEGNRTKTLEFEKGVLVFISVGDHIPENENGFPY